MENIEPFLQQIQDHLPESWLAPALENFKEETTSPGFAFQEIVHVHPRGCPKSYKVKSFTGPGSAARQPAIKLSMKGKFKCGNPSCGRSWSSAMSLLVVQVQPFCRVAEKTFRTVWTASAIEQACQKCERDVFSETCYKDEAESIAAWLVEAYTHGTYGEREQRSSKMRKPHDKSRCGACRANLH